MLTRLTIRNFKRFQNVSIELGKAVVLIGPNNCGKTTALQALALWDIGIRRWNERRKGKSAPEKRPGVTVNRRDLVSIPTPSANLLWRDLHVRDIRRTEEDGRKGQKTENVRVDIIVDGVVDGKEWSCGLEFDYANEESFYCRPLRADSGGWERMPIPDGVESVRVAFLPPMSGLADREFLKQPGEIGVLIGQGQTAQVLRNLCFQIHQQKTPAHFDDLVEHIKNLFGVDLLEPQYIAERSEIMMAYKDERDNSLDLSSAGRGLQQTLLLLDEPDAHLEILRQRQTYNLLVEVAERQRSQIIAASHSEVVLNEAAGRDVVISFVGKPHPIDNRGTQVLKALRDIGFDQYYQAEQTGWVLYVEDSTDLAILRTFAEVLGHRARKWLERPFVRYVETNLPERARHHFYGLRDAKPDFVGIAIFDRLEKPLKLDDALTELMWHARGIENYFCKEKVLLAYARLDQPDDLFGRAETGRREAAMRQAIAEVTQALRTLGRPDPWSAEIKATDEFLDPLFKRFFEQLVLPLQLRKSDYHVLAGLVPEGELDPEVTEKLDAICEVAEKAKLESE